MDKLNLPTLVATPFFKRQSAYAQHNLPGSSGNPSGDQFISSVSRPNITNVHFAGLKLDPKGEFEIDLDDATLDDIINNKMRTTTFDIPDAVYAQLSPGNQKALIHMVRAAKILDSVFLKQDHPDNIRAKRLLEKAAAAGNETARKALMLFTLHNGIEGVNMYTPQSEPLRLFKNKQLQPGKGFYPQDLTKAELIKYILAHPEQASSILSNNTIVRRQGKRLVAIPYSVAFRREFEAAAKELLLAEKATDHAGLKEYLRWQAQALVNDSDPEMAFKSDRSWINLEDSPLEFTIGRESYEDRMSSDVATDPAVAKVLKELGIKAKSKDSIGVRVGIVNKDSYAIISQYRQHLEDFAKHNALLAPFVQTNSTPGQADGKMTFADVDLVAYTGDYAAIRGGTTVAQNLPNDDKLAPQLNAGSRLVFHRSVRQSVDPAREQKFKDALIDPSQQAYYQPDAMFRFVVGHEIAHSLGPKQTVDGRDKKAALGQYGDMLEENKADLISLVMTGYFVQTGVLTQDQANAIYLTWAAGELPFKQPSLDEAHRARSIMQLNYLREKGAIKIEPGGKLSIVPDKMPVAAEQMLKEVIQLQQSGDVSAAEKFVKYYAAWNDTLQYIADEQNKLHPKLYRYINQPFAKKLLAKQVDSSLT